MDRTGQVDIAEKFYPGIHLSTIANPDFRSQLEETADSKKPLKLGKISGYSAEGGIDIYEIALIARFVINGPYFFAVCRLISASLSRKLWPFTIHGSAGSPLR